MDGSSRPIIDSTQPPNYSDKFIPAPIVMKNQKRCFAFNKNAMTMMTKCHQSFKCISRKFQFGGLKINESKNLLNQFQWRIKDVVYIQDKTKIFLWHNKYIVKWRILFPDGQNHDMPKPFFQQIFLYNLLCCDHLRPSFYSVTFVPSHLLHFSFVSSCWNYTWQWILIWYWFCVRSIKQFK